MIGAGTFINPLLKIVTTVAILAAVYYFMVRPILDTTEKAFDVANPALENAQQQLNEAFSQAEQQIQGTQTFDYTVTGPPKQVRRVTRCVERASNVAQIQRCLP